MDRKERMSVAFILLMDAHLVLKCLHLNIQIVCVGGWEGGLPPLWLLLLLVEQVELLLPSTGASVPSTKSSVFSTTLSLETLSSLPFPNRSLCPFNSTKNSVLSIFLLTDTPEVSVRILVMLSRECLLWIRTGKFVKKELSLLVLCETCSWNQQLEFRTSFAWKQCYKRQILRFSLEWANPDLTHTELRWIL